MERKNVVLLTVIAVATLLTAMVGSTFAFFTATISGEGNNTEIVNATTATVTATYSDGSQIKLENIAPGDHGEKEISITNTSGVDIDYTISFADYTNSGFVNLEYKLENGTGGNNTDIDAAIEGIVDWTKMQKDNLNGTNKLVSGHLGANETHNFKLSIQLKETNAAQKDDENQTFTGKLQAEAKASKVGQ